jgi:hypothetical protein
MAPERRDAGVAVCIRSVVGHEYPRDFDVNLDLIAAVGDLYIAQLRGDYFNGSLR